ncbi:MAG: hypothetical protein J6Q43_01340, partial [Bacteroidaceae bacterium]|nr:hypothetical protein [Bacteroidaceae bacterium]
VKSNIEGRIRIPGKGLKAVVTIPLKFTLKCTFYTMVLSKRNSSAMSVYTLVFLHGSGFLKKNAVF